MFKAMGGISDIDRIAKEHKINATYPNDFIKEVKQDQERVDSINFLAQKQLEIMKNSFGDEVESQQKAFEDFGQGVLYDERSPRPLERRIHMMDEGQFGFYRWHVFIRTAALLNIKPERLIHLDRHIGLACAIDSKQNPKQSIKDGSNPMNPEISPEILDNFRSFWLSLSFEELDKEFDKQFA